ncbi:hypothetical protein AGMMS4957_13590 [Bacteroidia bacterium]|nr:hypothetical protein AGMMS4957_13590 [Bacteroidia bacterium]
MPAIFVFFGLRFMFFSNDHEPVRMRHATPEQRANFEYNNIGIHWEELNEDFSFNGFISKKGA